MLHALDEVLFLHSAIEVATLPALKVPCSAERAGQATGYHRDTPSLHLRAPGDLTRVPCESILKREWAVSHITGH